MKNSIDTVVIELQNKEKSVKSIAVDYKDLKVIDKAYNAVFSELTGDSLVVELMKDAKPIVSIKLEPGKFAVSEIVDYLHDSLNK